MDQLKSIAIAVLAGSVLCAAQLAIKPATESDNVPTIDERYLIFKPVENEFPDETPELSKTIPAGFHNPTLVVSPESRKNIDDKMEKVGKGLCYASIATFILSGGGDTRLCGY
ncbi:hypothetical protein [Fibrobacter succinogenes]|uniref:Uncharacterized protein n=1 Tax=Fibrobacter succinogenes TaxID=833 RepID=A0A380RX11_FIBSU|nr:hypothetical protein [Fibrobacter succinogenes]PWJ37594.1 hypothetical protein IE02_1085 [Fibrobacter succinogenes subsp. elongatus]SUQ19841.1 hypothetical protein SAMN05661053_1085 [Fibrobacter succinogenes]